MTITERNAELDLGFKEEPGPQRDNNEISILVWGGRWGQTTKCMQREIADTLVNWKGTGWESSPPDEQKQKNQNK